MDTLAVLADVLYVGLVAASMGHIVVETDFPLVEQAREWLLRGKREGDFLFELLDCSVCSAFWFCLLFPLQHFGDSLTDPTVIWATGSLAAWSVARHFLRE